MDAPDIQPVEKAEFNPKPLLKEIGKGNDKKPFLGAHEAITWFTNDHPAPEGRILTFIDFENKMVRAEIYVGDVLVATGHSIGDGTKSLEKLETGAVRRALANAGYGTAAALTHEDDDEIATQARAAVASHELDEAGVNVREKLGSGKNRKIDTSKDAPPPDDYPNLRAILRDIGMNSIASITPVHDLEGHVRIEYGHPRNVQWVRKELANAIGEDKLGEMTGKWCNIRWTEAAQEAQP